MNAPLPFGCSPACLYAWRGGVRVLRTVGECIHVSAIYLGLAVLTTLMLSLALPSMRQQSQQLHEVVLAMFQTPRGADWPESVDLPDWGQFSPAAFDASASQLAEAFSENTAEAVLPADLTGFKRTLAASIADLPLEGMTTAQRHALGSYLSRKYRIARVVADALVRTAFQVGHELKLDPQLLLAVIAIESRYNPFVESAVGAQGLMQVMTRVHQDKLADRGGSAGIFDPAVNVRVGGAILADCIKRRGSLAGGLACYVGATGPGDGGYGAKVLAERRRMALASGVAPDR